MLYPPGADERYLDQRYSPLIMRLANLHCPTSLPKHRPETSKVLSALIMPPSNHSHARVSDVRQGFVDCLQARDRAPRVYIVIFAVQKGTLRSHAHAPRTIESIFKSRSHRRHQQPASDHSCRSLSAS